MQRSAIATDGSVSPTMWLNDDDGFASGKEPRPMLGRQARIERV
ncbi:MAG: hypothetical protein R3C05_08530 [Pirellulaceae bacterium]